MDSEDELPPMRYPTRAGAAPYRLNAPPTPRSKRQPSLRETTSSVAGGYSSGGSKVHRSPPPTYSDVDGDYEEDDGLHSGRRGRYVEYPRRRNTASSSSSYAAREPRHRRSQSLLQSRTSTDDYLDSLLERSVHALEMSNTLLQSNTSTRLSLQNVIHSEQALDRSMARQQRSISYTLREREQAHEGWMDSMDRLVEDVEDLFDEPDHHRDVYSTTGSLPSTSNSPLNRRTYRRPYAQPMQPIRRHRFPSDEPITAGLQLIAERPRSPPPRALTQYVSVTSNAGYASEETAGGDSIYLPSTNGLRAASHLEGFLFPPPESKRRQTEAPSPTTRHYSAQRSPLPDGSDRSRGQSQYARHFHHQQQSSISTSASGEPYSPTHSLAPSDSISQVSSAYTSPPASVAPYRAQKERRGSLLRPRHTPLATHSTPDLSLTIRASQTPTRTHSRTLFPPSRSSSTDSRSRSSPVKSSPQPPPSSYFNPDAYFTSSGAARLDTIVDTGHSSSSSEAESNSHLPPIAVVQEPTAPLARAALKLFSGITSKEDREGRTFKTAATLRKILDRSPNRTTPVEPKPMTGLELDTNTIRKGTMKRRTSDSSLHPGLYTSPSTSYAVPPRQRNSSSITSRPPPKFMPNPSMLPQTSTSTATVSVGKLRAIPLSPEEEEEERRRKEAQRTGALRGSRQGSRAGSEAGSNAGSTAGSPKLGGIKSLLPISFPGTSSGASTPSRLNVSFATEPPKYSDERKETGGNGGKPVPKKGKDKGKGKDEETSTPSWLSWVIGPTLSTNPGSPGVGWGRGAEERSGSGLGGGRSVDDWHI